MGDGDDNSDSDGFDEGDFGGEMGDDLDVGFDEDFGGDDDDSSPFSPKKTRTNKTASLNFEDNLRALILEETGVRLDVLREISENFGSDFEGLDAAIGLLDQSNQEAILTGGNSQEIFARLSAEQERLAGEVGDISPEEQAKIQEATDQALALATSDINAARDDQFRELQQTFAPSRGLRGKEGRTSGVDTPILDRADLIGRESVRQIGQAARGLRGQQLEQELQRPLQTTALRSGILSTQQQFQRSRMDFVQRLKESNFENKLRTVGLRAGFFGVGTGAASGLSAVQAPTLAALAKPEKKKTGIGELLGGVGSLLALF